MNRPKRLLFVSPRFPKESTIGGAETLLKNLALRAAAAGCEVRFLATCATNHFTWANQIPPGEEKQDNLTVHFFPVRTRNVEQFLKIQTRISAGALVAPEEEMLWMQNNVNSTELCDFIRRYGKEYDRIIAGPYLFGLICEAAAIYPDRTSILPCLHDEPFAYLGPIKRMFENVSSIIFNSEPEMDLAHHIYNIDRKSAYVVGMGIEAPQGLENALKPSATPEENYVLYSGRREPMKGTPLLVDYMRTFRKRTKQDIRLVFTGSGHVDISSEMLPFVTDLGFVSEKEKYAVMAGATAFCHPSVNESFGIVLLESWMAGTPALVHSKGRVLRYHCEKSNAGLWFNNYPEFEQEMVLLIENSSLRKRLGSNGRKYVEQNYSWEIIDKKFFQAIQG